MAVSLAVLAVLFYIWMRLEWQFGVGAVVALVHDVALTVGFFAVTQLEFNLSIIAVPFLLLLDLRREDMIVEEDDAAKADLP